MPISQRIAERYIGHEIRPLHELEKNITILLINTHPAFEPAIPLPPNAIEIGGLHAQPLQATDEKAVIYPDVRFIISELINTIKIVHAKEMELNEIF